jgi:2,4-didehydro-3-deoxy-L-rhamnonate hydrolase
MRFCRYDDDRIGLVRGNEIFDATAALDLLPPLTWPVPQGDHLIANLDALRPALESAADESRPRAIGSVSLKRRLPTQLSIWAGISRPSTPMACS